jgi:D-inositol-3-phosphate glycosyltransferase
MSGQGRRVVLVSRGLDPIGTGRQVLLAAAGLAERGCEVHLATVSHDGSPEGPFATGSGGIAAIHSISSRPAPSNLPVDPAAIGGLARLLRRGDFDLVEAWGWSSGVAAAAARVMAGLARGRRPPLAIRAATPPGGSWPRRAALSQAEIVLADGDEVAAACREAAPGTPVVVVPPGIPTEPINPAKPAAAPPRDEVAARYGLRADRPWTLSVAPLESPSRLERLLWAMDQIDVVHREVEHLLIGAGSQSARLARRARVQHVADRLKVVPCLRPPIHDGACDLVAHASIVWQSGEVALGGAILEAMAVGRPIVAVESMAACNLIEDGVSGLIVPADPTSEFPRQAVKLLEDATLAARLGEAARLRAIERFSLQAFQAAHAAAMERITSRIV